MKPMSTKKSITKKQNGDLEPQHSAVKTKHEEIEPVVKELKQLVEIFKGPLPPPTILKQYNTIDPTFADRIVKMAKGEQQHRQNMDKYLIEGQFRERRIGQIFGLIIGIAAIIGGVVASLFGAEISGGFIGFGGVIGLVAVFVIGRRTKKK